MDNSFHFTEPSKNKNLGAYKQNKRICTLSMWLCWQSIYWVTVVDSRLRGATANNGISLQSSVKKYYFNWGARWVKGYAWSTHFEFISGCMLFMCVTVRL